MRETLLKFSFIMLCASAVIFLFGHWIPWCVKHTARYQDDDLNDEKDDT